MTAEVRVRERTGRRKGWSALAIPCVSGIALPASLDEPAFSALSAWLGPPTQYRRGTLLQRAGFPFAGLLVVCVGACKSIAVTEDGSEDVAAFHLPSEFVSSVGWATGDNAHTVMALDDVQVRALPREQIAALLYRERAATAALIGLLTGELARQRLRTTFVYAMHVPQRVAAFLLDLSARFERLGYSAREFNLPMRRHEIGRHLGVKLETISRVLSWMHRHSLIQVQGRTIKLLDRLALEGLLRDAEAINVHH